MESKKDDVSFHLGCLLGTNPEITYLQNTWLTMMNEPPKVFVENKIFADCYVPLVDEYYKIIQTNTRDLYGTLKNIENFEILPDPVRFNPWFLKHHTFKGAEIFVLLKKRSELSSRIFGGKTPEESLSECQISTNIVSRAIAELRLISEEVVITNEKMFPTKNEVVESLNDFKLLRMEF